MLKTIILKTKVHVDINLGSELNSFETSCCYGGPQVPNLTICMYFIVCFGALLNKMTNNSSIVAFDNYSLQDDSVDLKYIYTNGN